jgi:uncharacterized membrane protein (DUF2068 family)
LFRTPRFTRRAEYFTIVTTGGLVPLETFELARDFTVTKVGGSID